MFFYTKDGDIMKTISVMILGLTVIGVIGCHQLLDAPANTSAEQEEHSAALRSVIAQYGPMTQTGKHPVIAGFWDDVLSVLKVVGADLIGAVVGAGIATEAVPGNVPILIVGAVGGAIISSVEAAGGLVAPGSPNPFNDPLSPYQGSKPATLDSIGWLHNHGVMYSVINGSTLSGSEVFGNMKSYLLTTHGWSSTPFDTITWSDLDSSITAIGNSATIAEMLTVLDGDGLGIEADYIGVMFADLEWLANNNYPSVSAFDLISSNMDGVDALSISSSRKLALKYSLSICSYSLAMWVTNN